MKKILTTMVNSAAATLAALVIANLYDKKDDILSSSYNGLIDWYENRDLKRLEKVKRKEAYLLERIDRRRPKEPENESEYPEVCRDY